MNDLTAEYNQDFCKWLESHVSLLREGRLAELDIKNLVEELEGMSKSQHHELVNRLRVLLAHLLKWQFQSPYRSNSWKSTIVEQRQQILQLLETSPSLNYQLEVKIAKAYAGAVKYAAAETGIAERDFPTTCPYTLAQILDEEYYAEVNTVGRK
jgi:hypothetical protein